LNEVRPPWSVNAMAQAAAVAALRDEQHLTLSINELACAGASLIQGLTEAGLDVWSSSAPYFLVRVGQGSVWRRALLRRSILVRDAASFGLPAFVRLGTRRPAENARL